MHLLPGEVVPVDVQTEYEGFHGDTSATFFIGEPSEEARHVTRVAEGARAAGIAAVGVGVRLGEVGSAIEEFARSQGCSVVRDLGGHGIGRRMHEDPHVPHHAMRGGVRLRAGMCFTIEPMVNLGTGEVEFLDDGWTVLTRDRRLSAQFEHTILLTDEGPEILT